MADPKKTGRAPKHPSPHRHQVAKWRLTVGLVGAPLVWMTIMLAVFGLADVGCSRFAPGGLFSVGALSIAGAVISVLASAACNWVAWDCWRKSRAEAPGDRQEAEDVGEGRTRFFAITGIWSSVIFAVASVFTLIAVLMVPPC